MKLQKKQKNIAAKVTEKIFLILLFMCICLSFSIQNAFFRELSLAENQYMVEVLGRISAEVNGELNHYIDASQTTAKSQTIKEYLRNAEQGILSSGMSTEIAPPTQELDILPEVEEQPTQDEVSESFDDDIEGEIADVTVLEEPLEPQYTEILSQQDTYLMSDILGYESALTELKDVTSTLGSSVLYMVICSVAQDNFFNSDGAQGDSDFTLSTRPFYTAYTSQKNYITAPYEEALTGINIITIAEPIFDDGRVIGMILIQLSLEKLCNIVTSSSFGTSGTSMLLDRNNNIIAYSNPAIVGMNVSQLNYSGDIADKELSNPTGEIGEYSFGGEERTGAMISVSSDSGWKLLLAMDSNEFKSNISIVARRLNIGLTIAVAVCCALSARWVYLCLAPMKKLEEFMSEIAQGNLTTRMEFEEMDEVGRLGEHMNKTAASLCYYIDIIDRALSNISDGDFNRPTGIVFIGDYQKIEQSLDHFTSAMSNSMQDVKTAMSQINQGSEQVAIGAQQLSVGSAEQNSAVESLHHLIGDINQAIVETAKNSSSVTSDAKNISDNLVISNKKMHELAVSVQDIRSMSDEVKRIIKSIEDVAFQTNILSLNASVEAARAGTAGRGFAVVADQVRLLSASTAEAADQTTKIINDIADAIEAGTNLAESTSKELQNVVDDVDVFVGNISSISLSTQDQAEAIAEINRGINEISKVVMQNSAISEESAASSEQLSSQSTQMLNMVDKYKLIE